MRTIFKTIALIQIFLFGILATLTLFYKIYQDRKKINEQQIALKVKQLFLDYQNIDTKDFHFLQYHRQTAFRILFDMEKEATLPERSIYIAILNDLFLPHLQEYVYSSNWFLRNQAAMLLQLKYKYFNNFVNPVDEEFLMLLIDDSVAKVSINACIAALFFPTQKLIDHFIDLFSQKRRSQYEISKTIINQSAMDVALCIEKRLSHEKNPYIRAFCYRILSEFPKLELAIPFLHSDLESEEIDLKLASLAYLYHVQKPHYKDELIKAIHSPHWEVRARCAKLMGYTEDEHLVKELEPLLKDDVWWVRFRAAEALSKMGEQGQQILRAQDVKLDKFAYEMSQQQLESSSFNRGK